MRLLTIFLIFISFFSKAQHPVAFVTRPDIDYIKTNLSKYPILQKSYAEIKQGVDVYLGKNVDVPFPKDPQGGYTHDRHKENYMLLFNAGLLYNLTGDNKYAILAKNIFKICPTKSPFKKSPSGNQQFTRS